MGEKGCLLRKDNKHDMTISLITVKTITKTGKNQNSVEKKLRQESVEAN